jgi:hypothetical protein
MVKQRHTGRVAGVTYSRWQITEDDRRAIARYLGQTRPVSLRRAREFLEVAASEALAIVRAETEDEA